MPSGGRTSWPFHSTDLLQTHLPPPNGSSSHPSLGSLPLLPNGLFSLTRYEADWDRGSPNGNSSTSACLPALTHLPDLQSLLHLQKAYIVQISQSLKSENLSTSPILITICRTLGKLIPRSEL